MDRLESFGSRLGDFWGTKIMIFRKLLEILVFSYLALSRVADCPWPMLAAGAREMVDGHGVSSQPPRGQKCAGGVANDVPEHPYTRRGTHSDPIAVYTIFGSNPQKCTNLSYNCQFSSPSLRSGLPSVIFF